MKLASILHLLFYKERWRCGFLFRQVFSSRCECTFIIQLHIATTYSYWFILSLELSVSSSWLLISLPCSNDVVHNRFFLSAFFWYRKVASVIWLEFIDLVRYSRMVKMEYYCILPKNSLPFSLWSEPRSSRFQNDLPPNLPQNCKCTGIICSMPYRARWCSPMTSFTASNSLNHGASSWSEDHLSNGNIVSEGASEKDLPQKLGTDEVIMNLLHSFMLMHGCASSLIFINSFVNT